MSHTARTTGGRSRDTRRHGLCTAACGAVYTLTMLPLVVPGILLLGVILGVERACSYAVRATPSA